MTKIRCKATAKNQNIHKEMQDDHKKTKLHAERLKKKDVK